ncbi:MAG: M1 family metallopeptidase [Firmicutes bacterium]|nr:M1 family metallopeptidase [Bacillota bacterium]
MKRIKAVFFALIMAAISFSGVVIFSACNRVEFSNSKYTIIADFDCENGIINAELNLDFINCTDIAMPGLKLHLFPRAYREGARFPAISASEIATAFPNGISYGDMTILSVYREGKEVSIIKTGEDEDILFIEGEIAPGARVVFDIKFRVDLPRVRHRLGIFDGVVNLGNWFPIASVFQNGEFSTFPYFSIGDPFFSRVADFDVTISTRESLVVATSGSQQTRVENGRRITIARIDNARDFAASIAEFNVVSETRGGVEVNFYFKQHTNANEILTVAFEALDTFGKLFGNYAYDSLSIVKTPFLHGGMEYPAIIFISDALSLDFFIEVVVHEIAHQWWYAAVGNCQITEPWIDEGLAEYSTSLFFEFNPRHGVTMEQRISAAWRNYVLFIDLYKDGGRGDTSMNRHLYQFSTSIEYAILVYTKGGLMFDTLRAWIGDNAFFDGLKNFYSEFMFGIATGDDLIKAFENASGRNLASFFDSWLNGRITAVR